MSERARIRQKREAHWRAWMTGAQSGDSTSYNKLLQELLPYLRQFVGRRLGDPTLTDDVVQNVLISIHRARHTYRPERPFGPWLHAIARNAVIDAARARKRRTRREVFLEEQSAEPAVSAKQPIESGLSQELESALATLTDGQREAVLLIHVEGLSVVEAAAQAGVSTAALKVRAHRGYKALRTRLAQEKS